MMETFLVDAENSLHHRANAQDGSGSSEESEDPMDDPFLYDKFLPDPDWAKAKKEEAKPKNLVDPGPFRYNKRIFVTSLPALLLVLALGGETLVLMAAISTAVITIMSQLGDSRRCVITFVVLFIPIHTYVLASVAPLLWLSLWHFFLVALVNVIVVLSAGWVLLQFKAFRMEEPNLAAVIEQMLFTVYPLACTCLVCWALGAVISSTVIPTIFSFIWFVLLQLYLIPTLSSFRTQTSGDENLDVVQLPIVVATVALFVMLGPLLHILLSIITAELLSLTFLVHFTFILFLTLFLSTLLSIRQIFEFLGLPYSTAIYVRWISGVVCTGLCYPVFQAYGLDSHFLPLLPVAIAMFAALGVVLAFKRRRIVMAVLAAVLVISLVALFILWIQRMPHHLQHYFMGIFPMNAFYLMICFNFLLCLLCLWTASVDAKEMLGALLILQAIVLTICEVSLHNTNLYSTSLLQLTSITAGYTVHRLHVAEKIFRGSAIISCAIHMAKSLASAMSLVLDGGKGEITFLEMAALGLMTCAIISVFVYGSHAEKSVFEITKQLLTLLAALAVNCHHFLLPISMLMFQGSMSYTNVIGLWCMLGGGLVLLYSQTTTSTYSVAIVKVALALAIMAVFVMLLHPPLSFSAYSIFQWAEIVSVFTLAAILSLRAELSPQAMVVASIVLAICPGLRACIYLWSQMSLLYAGLCVADSISLLILVFVCVFITEMTEASDKIMKYSVGIAMTCSLCLLVSDCLQLMSATPSPSGVPVTVLDLPAWQAVFITCLIISVVLKVVQSTKGPDKLPLTSEGDTGGITLPVIANIITVFTFFVACTQGPSDPTLHDLWCCTSTIILGCLHRDATFLPRLNGDKQATPTIMASAGILILATMVRSRFWTFLSFWIIWGGLIELVLIVLTLPVFYNAWSILWRGQVASESAVVFLTPYSVLLFLLCTSYTGWILAMSCLLAGVWMMMYKLPMVPYNIDPLDHYR